jgi:hypothetical protein
MKTYELRERFLPVQSSCLDKFSLKAILTAGDDLQVCVDRCAPTNHRPIFCTPPATDASKSHQFEPGQLQLQQRCPVSGCGSMVC